VGVVDLSFSLVDTLNPTVIEALDAGTTFMGSGFLIPPDDAAADCFTSGTTTGVQKLKVNSP
jgi:hypothetical protein